MSTAYVLINCETGSEDYIISQLKLIESVKNVAGTFGSYDIITKLESANEEKLRQDISKNIRKLKKIRATLTLISEDPTNLFGKTLNDEEKEILDRYASQAYVIVHCDETKERDVLQNMSKIPEVVECNTLIGSYELLCKVVVPTYNDISDVVTKKIRRIENIKTTITLNVIP